MGSFVVDEVFVLAQLVSPQAVANSIFGLSLKLMGQSADHDSAVVVVPLLARSGDLATSW